MVKTAFTVTDKEAFLTARDLLLKEGILAGSSTGVLVCAALKYAQQQTEPKKIVTFVCDSGNKYLSKMYNDYWMIDNGFIEREKLNDLRDIISRSTNDKSVVTVKPEDTILQAYSKMKLYDISQIPVMENEKVIGILDEYDILLALEDENTIHFKNQVSEFMSLNLETLKPDDSHEKLIALLKKGHVAIIEDEMKFYGIITKIDFINYMKRKIKD